MAELAYRLRNRLKGDAEADPCTGSVLDVQILPVPADIEFYGKHGTPVFFVPLIDEIGEGDEAWREWRNGMLMQAEASAPAGGPLPIYAAMPTSEIVIQGYQLFQEIEAGRLSAEATVERALAILTLAVAKRLKTWCAFIDGESGQETAGVRAVELECFISYSRRDDHSKGWARHLREHLLGGNTLKGFLDTQDMEIGLRWQDQLTSTIGASSIVIALQTDTYASREWCRREITIAKTNDRPIVVLNCVQASEARTFPYLGNTPSLRVSDLPIDLDKILVKLFEELLAWSVWNATIRLQDLAGDASKTLVLRRPPELLTLAQRGVFRPDGPRRIIYPDPEIPAEELEVLQMAVGDDCAILSYTAHLADLERRKTEATLPDPAAPPPSPAPAPDAPIPLPIPLPRPLQGRVIGMSVAVNESLRPDWDALGLDADRYVDVLVELSRGILAQGGRLLYGGRPPETGSRQNLTEILFNLAEVYAHSSDGPSEPLITNAFAWSEHAHLSPEELRARLPSFESPRVRSVFLSADGREIPVEERLGQAPVERDPAAEAGHLRTMREWLVRHSHARVAMGGRLQRSPRDLPGILDESVLSMLAGQPCLFASGFGGATLDMIGYLDPGRFAGSDLLERTAKARAQTGQRNPAMARGYSGELLAMVAGRIAVRDGLNAEQRKRLAVSTSPMELTSLILAGLQTALSS